MKGYIHIYTGNGKGKTTAAFGLALRATGAGKNVFIGQFVKGQIYSEILAVQKYCLPVTVKQYGLECFIVYEPTQKDIDIARRGLKEISEVIRSGRYDMVILDEANIALYYKLFTVEELLAAIKKKPEETEIVITGRYAPPELIDFADLVTEMKEIKHYYTRGVQARGGIEF
ncbi:MAG: cob(I)yrinic acid a,c-diamide adenosyltransferase [Candidatus Marinimicrobia bacterium]|nr:cob(I)yrinic acid a,c-diamide adenosyltransferase [Candidatus Neomarinimicrobiota bacterium]